MSIRHSASRIRRGIYRGFFACVVMLCAACDKTSTPSKNVAAADAGSTDAGTADALGTDDATAPEDGFVDAGVARAPEPEPFDPPWTVANPPWAELKESIAGQDVGRLSGEIYGDDKVVRAVVRTQCGGGTMLQAVYQDERRLRVTPAMPLRFIDLATGKAVTYEENEFRVTVDFDEDRPDRLKGHLKIEYDDEGEGKSYVDLKVDAEPLDLPLEPRLEHDERVPEFHPCHPSGWFRARAADGREAEGMLNATLSPDGNAAVISVLLSPQTGLRIVVVRRKGAEGPVEIDLGDVDDTADLKIIPEAFFRPELTDASEALGGNLGAEETANLRRGNVVVAFADGKRPKVSLRFTELAIPMLLDGPLRGTTFDELKIEARAFPAETYPSLPPKPSWDGEESEDGR